MATRGGPFGAGRVLGRSFRIWGRNIVKFTILHAIVYVPLVAYAILASPRLDPEGPALRSRGLVSYLLVLTFGWCLLWFIAPLAVIQGVLQQVRGEPASFSGCLRVYLTRLFPALGVGLLVALLACLSMLPALILAGILTTGGGSRALAMIVLLIPAVFVGCVYWVAVPVAAAERPGLVAALRRSARLTRGSRFSVFAIVLVVLALWFIPTLIVGSGPPAGPLTGWAYILMLMVCGGYGAVVTSVAYHDLRVAREGIGVDDLVRVFA